MRILILIIFNVWVGLSPGGKVFEGELIYHHDFKMRSADYTQSRHFYDTLTILYKDKNYIKLTNKREYEKILFIDSLKKIYIIYKDNLSRSENLSMNEDNLNFGKLYSGENSHFGKIFSVSKSDTTLNLYSKDRPLKKLFVERDFGYETYVYSEPPEFKFTDGRNILRNIGQQIHPEEIATALNNSIIYYYKIEAKDAELLEEFRLVKINYQKIEANVFEIPEHKDAKGFKKVNKEGGRFRYFELTK